jgi:hypothetical protein
MYFMYVLVPDLLAVVVLFVVGVSSGPFALMLYTSLLKHCGLQQLEFGKLSSSALDLIRVA